jgi:single-strand DNA-binding protein
MFELNKVFLAGNLTRDPELKYIPSGMAVADLGLAVNRRRFDRNAGERVEETLYISVTAWEKTAEFCGKYLHKGSAIVVEGRLKMDRWDDKQTGRPVTKITVVAERVQFAESRRDSEGSGGGERYRSNEGPGGGGAPSREAAPQVPPDTAPAGEQTKDDLPF